MERDGVFRHDYRGRATYYDGTGVLGELWLALGGDPSTLLAAAQPPAPDSPPETPEAACRRHQAARLLVEGARRAFALPLFDPATGEGATAEQCLAVLDAWLNWMENRNVGQADRRLARDCG